MHTQRWKRMVAGLALLLPTLAQGQLLVSTGASVTNGLDNRWQVTTTPTASAPTWTAASVVTTPPGQWTGGAPGGTWISATASGSGGGGTYAVRTLFTLATGDLFTATYRCAFDNAVVSLWINGSQVSGVNPCGSQLHVWGPTQTLTQALFNVGQNSLEFRWNGDNTTDGIAVQFQSLNFTPANPNTPPVPGVVPEPASVVLMATGLLGLGAVARRRRERGPRTQLV